MRVHNYKHEMRNSPEWAMLFDFYSQWKDNWKTMWETVGKYEIWPYGRDYASYRWVQWREQRLLNKLEKRGFDKELRFENYSGVQGLDFKVFVTVSFDEMEAKAKGELNVKSRFWIYCNWPNVFEGQSSIECVLPDNFLLTDSNLTAKFEQMISKYIYPSGVFRELQFSLNRGFTDKTYVKVFYASLLEDRKRYGLKAFDHWDIFKTIQRRYNLLLDEDSFDGFDSHEFNELVKRYGKQPRPIEVKKAWLPSLHEIEHDCDGDIDLIEHEYWRQMPRNNEKVLYYSFS